MTLKEVTEYKEEKIKEYPSIKSHVNMSYDWMLSEIEDGESEISEIGNFLCDLEDLIEQAPKNE